MPRAGWVEHDPIEIWTNIAVGDRRRARRRGALAAATSPAVGITNQRETAIVWDRRTGRPVRNAIVWQDTRTQPRIDRLAADGGADRFAEHDRASAGDLLLGIQDRLDPRERRRARERMPRPGELLFGTPDTWLIWNLTGGTPRRHPRHRCHEREPHAADGPRDARLVRRAARGVRHPAVDAARDRAVVRGRRRSARAARRAAACRSRASSAISRRRPSARRRSTPGESKNTYGTGNFLLVNTGTDIVRSQHGLITTVAYRCGDEPAHYALEGSIAVTGSLVQWLRDNLGIINSASEDVEASPRRSTTTAARTSCRPSRGCSRRTGGRMPAARSWGSPAS